MPRDANFPGAIRYEGEGNGRRESLQASLFCLGGIVYMNKERGLRRPVHQVPHGVAIEDHRELDVGEVWGHGGEEGSSQKAQT